VVEPSSEDIKRVSFLKMSDTPGEDKVSGIKAFFEIVKELPPEQCRHDSHGEEEPLAA